MSDGGNSLGECNTYPQPPPDGDHRSSAGGHARGLVAKSSSSGIRIYGQVLFEKKHGVDGVGNLPPSPGSAGAIGGGGAHNSGPRASSSSTSCSASATHHLW